MALKGTDNETYSAFDKAVSESHKVQEYHRTRREIVEGKREIIENIVKDRNKLIKEDLEKNKKELEKTLIKVIKDALKFTKENTPMISMMPTRITTTINQIKEEKKINTLNISNASLNLSFGSTNSTRSIQKYESNQFLKALGLDLLNLNVNNIKLDIDKAYNYIKRWKVKNEDINQVIRFKVVNEIMNVEERRSVQKIEKMNKRINLYLENKKLSKKKMIIRDESIRSLNNSNNVSVHGDKNMSMSFSTKQINTSTQKSVIKPKKEIKEKSVEKTTKLVSSKEKLKVTKKSARSISMSKNRLKNLKNEQNIKPKKLILNAYNNVEKIVHFINSNDELKENAPLLDHFNNIKYNKKIDLMTKALINKNKLNVNERSASSASHKSPKNKK